MIIREIQNWTWFRTLKCACCSQRWQSWRTFWLSYSTISQLSFLWTCARKCRQASICLMCSVLDAHSCSLRSARAYNARTQIKTHHLSCKAPNRPITSLRTQPIWRICLAQTGLQLWVRSSFSIRATIESRLTSLCLTWTTYQMTALRRN